MAYSAVQIANYFIGKGVEDSTPVDPLKLQKLVYLAHGWHLYFENAPLITESIEAWRYGPVVPELYRMVREYGSRGVGSFLREPKDASPLSPRTEDLLAKVWAIYGSRSGVELSMLTHEPGSAWDLTRRGTESPWSDAVIDNSLIKDEFRERQHRAKAA